MTIQAPRAGYILLAIWTAAAVLLVPGGTFAAVWFNDWRILAIPIIGGFYLWKLVK